MLYFEHASYIYISLTDWFDLNLPEFINWDGSKTLLWWGSTLFSLRLSECKLVPIGSVWTYWLSQIGTGSKVCLNRVRIDSIWTNKNSQTEAVLKICYDGVRVCSLWSSRSSRIAPGLKFCLNGIRIDLV